jgi:glycosyltransferase involved in cell wall biosynthesis
VKLIIQIPCLNEAGTIEKVLADLPKQMEGIDLIECLVIDDGSTDDTVKLAQLAGAHVYSLGSNRGLAAAFLAGLMRSAELGADIVVNTDGDNQYQASDIVKLVLPVLRKEADIVVGARPIEAIASFSRVKKTLQRFGSKVVSILSGATVPDATSGFRAFSRDAALRVSVFTKYTYTLETLIQAAQSGLRIVSVPINVNPVDRPSRLMRNATQYIFKAGQSLVRCFLIYRGFRVFAAPALLIGSVGVIGLLRFLVYYFMGDGASRHMQSLTISVGLLVISAVMFSVAVVVDLISANRKLLEELRYLARKEMLSKHDG